MAETFVLSSAPHVLPDRKQIRRLEELQSSLRLRWFFYCRCGNRWSKTVDGEEETAPYSYCPACHARVRGGL